MSTRVEFSSVTKF
jgi:hypothetical protein